VNFQVLEVNLFCVPKPIVVLLCRCLTSLLNPSFYDYFFGDECTDHSQDSGSNSVKVSYCRSKDKAELLQLGLKN